MGVKTQTCALCEKINYQFVSAIGHTYNDTVAKATCTEQGYTEHTCTDCDYNYRDTYTLKTAHRYGEWSVMLSTCTNCGKNYKDSYVAATGEHAWEDVYVVVSTCTERKVLKSCTVCDKTQVLEEKPTVEHDYTETLGWDATIWNFSDLDFENGKMPTLKA